jgi:hypothetical protein
VSSVHQPIERESIAAERSILDQPSRRAAIVERVAPGGEIPVLGQYGDYLYVEAPSGKSGWMPAN